MPGSAHRSKMIQGADRNASMASCCFSAYSFTNFSKSWRTGHIRPLNSLYMTITRWTRWTLLWAGLVTAASASTKGTIVMPWSKQEYQESEDYVLTLSEEKHTKDINDIKGSFHHQPNLVNLFYPLLSYILAQSGKRVGLKKCKLSSPIEEASWLKRYTHRDAFDCFHVASTGESLKRQCLNAFGKSCKEQQPVRTTGLGRQNAKVASSLFSLPPRETCHATFMIFKYLLSIF